MRINRLAAALLGALCATGCGVTFEAKRVSSADGGGKVPSVVSGEGIVYALPRTGYEIVQPVAIAVPAGGPLQDIFDDCRRACEATGGLDAAEACTFSTAPKVRFGPPELRTVALPDYSRVYQVSPSAAMFQSLDFKFEVGPSGVIESADASATNMTYELVGELAKQAVRVAGLGAGVASPAMAMMKKQGGGGGAPDLTQRCYAAAGAVEKLVSSQRRELSCALQRQIDACMAASVGDVAAERANLLNLYDDAARRGMDARLLATVAAYRRERLATAVEQRDAEGARYGLGEGKPKEATYQIVLPLPGPSEFLADDRSTALGAALRAGGARVDGTSENSAALLPKLASALYDDKRSYRVVTTPPAALDVVRSDESALLGGGYRYRVPVSGDVTLEVYAEEGKRDPSYPPRTERRVIAQYGPVAALPSTFKGKGGRVAVKLWPDSGGLHNVEIGAEALPTTAVTGVVDEAVGQYKARKDKQAAAAAAAAAADAELDALTRQQKILDLQKQIRDLQNELKN